MSYILTFPPVSDTLYLLYEKEEQFIMKKRLIAIPALLLTLSLSIAGCIKNEPETVSIPDTIIEEVTETPIVAENVTEDPEYRGTGKSP